MNQHDTPAKVASTDGLGPLPDYAPKFCPRWAGDEGGFTGTQMRAYAAQEVAVERELRLAVADAIERVICGRDGVVLAAMIREGVTELDSYVRYALWPNG